jgi:hypothetical protein
MAVENLMVVEGPLAGLGQETHACNLICRACSWMDGHGVSPSWLAAGAVISGYRGMFVTTVGSWLYRRVLGFPTDTLFGIGVASALAYVFRR